MEAEAGYSDTSIYTLPATTPSLSLMGLGNGSLSADHLPCDTALRCPQIFPEAVCPSGVSLSLYSLEN